MWTRAAEGVTRGGVGFWLIDLVGKLGGQDRVFNMSLMGSSMVSVDGLKICISNAD